MANYPTDPAATWDWAVKTVQDTTSLDANGAPVRGKQITYQLWGGQTGTVFVAAANFTPDAVKAAVAESAAQLQAVLNLNSRS